RHRPLSPLLPYTTLFRSRRAKDILDSKAPSRDPTPHFNWEIRRYTGTMLAHFSYFVDLASTLAEPVEEKTLISHILRHFLENAQDRKSTRLNSSHVSTSY